MEAKLNTVNTHLARAVFVAGAVFSIGMTLLATITGTTVLLIGTAFGAASAAYAVQVLQSSTSTEVVRARTDTRIVEAA